MVRCVLLIQLVFAIAASGQSLLEPEEHFFGIPNLDSLTNPWILALTDTSNPGFAHPVDTDILRLSPTDYRLVILDAFNDIFTTIRINQTAGVDSAAVIFSGASEDTSYYDAVAMCRIQQGTYFDPQTDRVAVAFWHSATVGIYLFDSWSGEFIQERTFTNPAIMKPVGIYWAFNQFFIADQRTQSIFRTDNYGNTISRYGQRGLWEDCYQWISDIDGYVDAGNTAHLYVCDGLNLRIDHLTTTESDTIMHRFSQVWATAQDTGEYNTHEVALVPGAGVVAFDRYEKRFYLWNRSDSLHIATRTCLDWPIQDSDPIHIRHTCGRLVVVYHANIGGWQIRSFQLTGADFDDPLPYPSDHWTTGNSPVTISNSYHIVNGTDLIIDAGVQVLFGRNASIVVDLGGTLTVNGTNGNEVRFESANPNDSEKRFWRGIYINSTGNEITYGHFEDGIMAIRALPGSETVLTQCTFDSCQIAVASVGGEIEITGGTIEVSGNHGILATAGSRIEINGGIISDAKVAGVWNLYSKMTTDELKVRMSGDGEEPTFFSGGIRSTFGSLILHCTELCDNVGPGLNTLGGFTDMGPETDTLFAPGGKNFIHDNTAPGENARTQVYFENAGFRLCNGRNKICAQDGILIMDATSSAHDVSGNYWCERYEYPVEYVNNGDDPASGDNRCKLEKFGFCSGSAVSELFAAAWATENAMQYEDAVIAYRVILETYPNSDEAKLCPDRIIMCDKLADEMNWSDRREYFLEIADTTADDGLAFEAAASAAWCLVEMDSFDLAQDELYALLDAADDNFESQKAALFALMAELVESPWDTVGNLDESSDGDRMAELFDRMESVLSGEVRENRVASIPTRYQLYQNYPNPFNPNTEIRFDLPENVQIELKVFNTLGQLVTTLADEIRPAGAYSIAWNGISQNGAPVSSGLYVYQLKAGNFSDSKKMILLR